MFYFTLSLSLVLQAFTQELESRSGVVNAMQTSMSMSLNSDPDRDPDVLAAVEELTSAWDRVNQLCILRDQRLVESLVLVCRLIYRVM